MIHGRGNPLCRSLLEIIVVGKKLLSAQTVATCSLFSIVQSDEILAAASYYNCSEFYLLLATNKCRLMFLSNNAASYRSFRA